MSASCRWLLHTPWRQAALRFLHFHSAMIRGPRVSLQYVFVNINFLLTTLKKMPKMSFFGSHARVTPSKNVVHCMSQFCPSILIRDVLNIVVIPVVVMGARLNIIQWHFMD
jgi:uncharacterized membrane-anchored protein YitT (DUF2179 family)